MKILVTILIFFISFSCFSQQGFNPIDKWKSYSIPLSQDSIDKYGFDLLGEWTVCIKDNKITAGKTRNKISDTLPFDLTPTEEFRGRRSVFQVSDGYLVGFYRGEWGGDLYWFSKDGKQNYKISSHEIVQFVKRDNKIYAIEGLSHLGSTHGSLIEIKQVNEKWITLVSLKLPSAPYGVDIDSKSNLVIITSKSLLKIDRNFKLKILTNDHFWYPGFYPTSLVIKDDIAYSGMRKGIFKYNLTSHRQEWLMND